jgi:ABC-2 type transport system ATP-binding protein
MINAEHLSRYYRVSQPGKGTWNKVKAFFAPEYKTIKAIDDVSFVIDHGEIVGYVGPNGAGKSTTIKLLTGVLTPTSGSVKVNSVIPHKNRLQQAYGIGVVYGQRSQLWWDLPLIDSYEILAAMYKLPRSRYMASLDRLVDLVQMEDFLEQPVRKLSLGQKMRADIAASLLHEPPILFLDEPTIGLDILTKKRIWDFLLNLNTEKGTTIILTTHDLSDVEQLCSRIIIIDKGRIALDDSKHNILQRFGKRRVMTVEFDHAIKDIAVSCGQIERIHDNKVWIQFDRDQISAFDLVMSLDTDNEILDITIDDEDIESIIARIYQGGMADEFTAVKGFDHGTE